MKRIGRFLVVLLAGLGLLVSALEIHAADISISASLDKNEIYIDDTVDLTIRINGSVGSLPDPNIEALNKDFEIVGTSTSTSISVINGSFQAEKDVVLQLKPLHAGTITIKDIYVEVGGTKYYINPLTLKVISTYQLPATGSTTGESGYSGSLTSYTIPPSVLNFGIGVVGEVTKRKVYVGEQFIYRFIFYNSRGLFGNPQYSPPQFKKVWKYDLLKEPLTRKIYRDGTLFQVQELRTAIIPLSPGKIVIPPAKLVAPLDFFSGNKILRTKPIVVTVYPLPETDQPDCFTGAVGDGYKVKLKTREVRVKVGDPIQVVVEITGPGNLNLSAPPPVTVDTDIFKSFKPQVNDSIITTPNGIIVDRKVTYIFQALKEGVYSIGPIYFCYFSPTRGEYERIPIGSVKVYVAKGNGGTVKMERHGGKILLRPPTGSFEVVDYPGTLTAYLMVFWKLRWPPFVILLLVVVGALLLGRIKQVVRETREERELKKESRKLEKKMKKLVISDKPDEFYEVWKKYFKMRWQINVDTLSDEDLADLIRKGMSEDVAELVLKITTAIHRHLYAGEELPPDWKKNVIEFLKRVD